MRVAGKEAKGCLDGEEEVAEIGAPERKPVPTIIPISWRRSASALVASRLVHEKSVKVCVCGGTSSGNGKNVYTRFLVNSILFSSGDEVAVIDGDCVHPEFASPGTVSLAVLRTPLEAPGAVHFPPGTHRQSAVVPLKSFFVSSSPKVLSFILFALYLLF